MENTELYHWGIKGMRWGIRRYQNPDGSLTPRGKKRYNAEVERLKKETAKVKAAEKVKANREKTQAKIDKLEAQKADLERRKRALKGKGDEEAAKQARENESNEERRKRLLESVDPKEIYEGRSLLTTAELNDRINRIDTEARLQGKIPQKEKKTAIKYMDDARNYINKSTELYKSVDSAYSTVLNSSIGKTLADKLGLSAPKESWFKERMRKYKEGKLNAQEMQEFNRYLVAENQTVNNLAARDARIAAERAARRNGGDPPNPPRDDEESSS